MTALSEEAIESIRRLDVIRDRLEMVGASEQNKVSFVRATIESQASEIARLREALLLVGRLHERKHPHIGPARESGLSNGCIPCIVVGALGTHGFTFTAEQLSERAALCAHGSG